MIIVLFVAKEEASISGAMALFGTSLGWFKRGLCPFDLGCLSSRLLGDLIAPIYVRIVLVIAMPTAARVLVRALVVDALTCHSFHQGNIFACELASCCGLRGWHSCNPSLLS